MGRGYVKSLRKILLAGCAVTALTTAALAQAPKTTQFDIPPEDLGVALNQVAKQSQQEIVFNAELARGKRSPALKGEYTPKQALDILLAGAGLSAAQNAAGVLEVQPKNVQAASNEGAANTNTSLVTESVVVTGTNIRDNVALASPVTAYTREDIARTGAPDVTSLLNDFTQNIRGGDFGSGPDSVFGVGADRLGNPEGAIAPNLHALGPGATLTLINGRRIAPANGFFPDIGNIPIGAIDRVDIVADGSSAIYGADAVGGVVNVILRNHFDGAETDVQHMIGADGNFDQTTVAQTIGHDWGSGNLLVTGQWSSSGGLTTNGRGFTASMPAANIPGAGVRYESLYPVTNDYSILASLNQSILPGLNLNLDAWYTYGDRNQLAVDTQFSKTQPDYTSFMARTQQVNVNGTLSYDVGSGWLIQASGGLSLSRDLPHVETAIPFGHLDIQESRSGQFDEYTAEAKADGPLFHLPGGDVRLAIGYDYRSDSYTHTDSTSRNGAAATFATIGDQRQANSAFGELSVPLVSDDNALPLVRQLSLTLAGRLDSYSDFGETTNGKIGILWAPTSDLHLRATYSTSFRPPDVYDESNAGNLTLSGAAFPSPAGVGTVQTVFVGGTSRLVPETSTNYSAGFDFTPDTIPGLKLSATWFNYDYHSKVAVPPFESIALSDPAEGSLVTKITSVSQLQALINSNGPGGFNLLTLPLSSYQYIYNDSIQNIAVQKVDGLDLSASYGFNLDGVDITTALMGTYYGQDARQNTPNAPIQNVVAIAGQEPSYHVRGSVTGQLDQFTGTVALNFLSGATNMQEPGKAHIGGWTTVDLNGRYRFTDDTLKGVSLSLAVLNLFDTDPPYMQRLYGAAPYDPAFANPLGREFSIRLIKDW